MKIDKLRIYGKKKSIHIFTTPIHAKFWYAALNYYALGTRSRFCIPAQPAAVHWMCGYPQIDSPLLYIL